MKKKKYLTGIVAVMAAVTVVWAVAVSLRSGASYVATVHKPGGGRQSVWAAVKCGHRFPVHMLLRIYKAWQLWIRTWTLRRAWD